ncbi:MAG TPA: 2Fe-2S iron-sulfur cluster-binding protein [Acidimicrobiales bacterium]|nr:2Fe-2S iron-sulfur cluster-binding protein [Acidimicrobiales bacterium]
MTAPTPHPRPPLTFTVDGRPVEVPDDGSSLLGVLRDRLGIRSPKDGCSPQGQCGCCTVLVDDQPRVACVTPARRVRGRAITTLDGLPEDERRSWAEAFCATGASQCGFCTPGIIVRLSGLAAKGTAADDTAAVEQALLAHLCRCTGWRTILDAWAVHVGGGDAGDPDRDLAAASRRATIEGRTPQTVSPEVALGHGGFADDGPPDDALVAVPDGAGGWAVGETLAEARAAAGKVQGRRTTAEVRHPLEPPPGDWAATLATTWVEPGYLELDASWCRPGGEPASPLANGGAFGGKLSTVVTAAARELADRHGRPVRVLLAREDAVRTGPKRPPVAGGMRADGTGVLRVVATSGIGEAVARVAPRLHVEQVEVPGPATSLDLRAAGWAEALVLAAGAGAVLDEGAAGPGVLAVERGAPGPGGTGRAAVALRSPDGAVARAEVTTGDDPRVAVEVSCGEVLDEVVLRSYCVGAAHMALGWVTSEGLAVDDEGRVHDLTIRSFGILRAVDMPPVDVTLEREASGPPVNGSDAVFAAVAAAAWLAQGAPPAWPTGARLR